MVSLGHGPPVQGLCRRFCQAAFGGDTGPSHPILILYNNTAVSLQVLPQPSELLPENGHEANAGAGTTGTCYPIPPTLHLNSGRFNLGRPCAAFLIRSSNTSFEKPNALSLGCFSRVVSIRKHIKGGVRVKTDHDPAKISQNAHGCYQQFLNE
ncbi:hypothetical protein BJV78DRAFT_1218619 [Lactifluus subvellereus]|nr:hypothetical protein BJV78DRAFT_1218619 [Lactifluus subvellereus]